MQRGTGAQGHGGTGARGRGGLVFAGPPVRPSARLPVSRTIVLPPYRLTSCACDNDLDWAMTPIRSVPNVH